MPANFKAPVTRAKRIRSLIQHREENLCKDPAYIEQINQKAEEEQMMQMYEHNLEPC